MVVLNMSIRLQLLIICLVLVTVPVLVLGVVSYQAYESLRTYMITISVAAIILGAAVAYIFAVIITRPLKMLGEISLKASKGNVDISVDEGLVGRGDEIGRLAESFGIIIENVKKKTKEIEDSRETAANATKELESSRSDLQSKLDELTKTKTAVLNMMEDMENTNKELVSTQDELKESLVKLEEMDARKDEFISIAAHELKTPLTSIHGFSQLLHNDAIAGSPPKRKKYLEIIDKESKRLANLVNEILDLSRIDLGTIKLVFEEVNLNEIIDSVRKEMDVPIKENGLKSEYHVEKKLPRIVTDRERLTQILINLINNAIKYTPKGKVTVTVKKEADYVNFSVKDTGIGISKENQKKVFERFYQVDSSYTRKTGGTGLGLSLCQEFVKMLGGDIWITSEVGKGSDFRFVLPLRAPPIGKEEKRPEGAKAAEVKPEGTGEDEGGKMGLEVKPEPKISIAPQKPPMPQETVSEESGGRKRTSVD